MYDIVLVMQPLCKFQDLFKKLKVKCTMVFTSFATSSIYHDTEIRNAAMQPQARVRSEKLSISYSSQKQFKLEFLHVQQSHWLLHATWTMAAVEVPIIHWLGLDLVIIMHRVA